MKVVSFDTLLGMPVGTVFTKYPLGLHELLIKGENEGTTFMVQHLSDTDDADGAELFDPEFEVTGKSFAMDTSNPWVDGDLGIHDSYIVYSAADVGEIIKLLRLALLGYSQPEQTAPQEEPAPEVDPDVAAWAAMSPEEKAVASKELLHRILHASPPANVESILKDVPLETSKEILKEMCEEMTGKPFPSSPFPSVSGDLVMDLVKNVGGPGFNEAFTNYRDAYVVADAVGKFPMTERTKDTYAKCVAEKGLIFNDHGPTGTKIQLWGLATLDKGEKQLVVALIDSRAFSINPVALHRGEPHLLSGAAGGVIELEGRPMLEAIVQYNKEQENMPWSNGTLNNVVQF